MSLLQQAHSLVNFGEIKGKGFALQRGALTPNISTLLTEVEGVVIGITTIPEPLVAGAIITMITFINKIFGIFF